LPPPFLFPDHLWRNAPFHRGAPQWFSVLSQRVGSTDLLGGSFLLWCFFSFFLFFFWFSIFLVFLFLPCWGNWALTTLRFFFLLCLALRFYEAVISVFVSLGPPCRALVPFSVRIPPLSLVPTTLRPATASSPNLRSYTSPPSSPFSPFPSENDHDLSHADHPLESDALLFPPPPFVPTTPERTGVFTFSQSLNPELIRPHCPLFCAHYVFLAPFPLFLINFKSGSPK